MLDVMKQYFRFTVKKRKVWLLPLSVALILMGALLIFMESSVIAPFIYTLF